MTHSMRVVQDAKDLSAHAVEAIFVKTSGIACSDTQALTAPAIVDVRTRTGEIFENVLLFCPRKVIEAEVVEYAPYCETLKEKRWLNSLEGIYEKAPYGKRVVFPDLLNRAK